MQEVEFGSEAELEGAVFDNYKLLFGESAFLIDTKKKLAGQNLGATIPDGFMFEFSDREEPRFYLIEVELQRHDFYRHIFPQVTKFFSFFKNTEEKSRLATKLYEEIIDLPTEMKNDFKSLIGGNEIYKSVNDAIDNPFILIVIDGEKPEFSEIGETYSATWGRMVSCITMRKFTDQERGEIIFQLEPDLEILNTVGDEKVFDKETTGYDEEHHTKGIKPEIVGIYEKLKERVLEINAELIFNPTKYYISMRENKNCAFIRFSKKRMWLTPLRPEEEIKECVAEKYEVRSLSVNTQRAFGGKCASVRVENSFGMDGLVDVLEPLISKNDE